MSSKVSGKTHKALAKPIALTPIHRAISPAINALRTVISSTVGVVWGVFAVPSPSREKVVSRLCFVAVLLFAARSVVALTLDYPVILVHGMGGEAEGWDEFKRLWKAPPYNLRFGCELFPEIGGDIGFSQCEIPFKADFYTVTFSDVSRNAPTPWDAQAIELSQVIDFVLSYHSSDSVVLIGHSMGGLVSRCYLQKPGYWYHPGQEHGQHGVYAMVTIGTPHLGSGGGRFSKLASAIESIPGVPWTNEEVQSLATDYVQLEHLNAGPVGGSSYTTLPDDVKYFSIIGRSNHDLSGDFTAEYSGDCQDYDDPSMRQGGDEIVHVLSQNLNNTDVGCTYQSGHAKLIPSVLVHNGLQECAVDIF